MVWKTLGESLEAALASMMNDGEGRAATRSDAEIAKKGADAKPAQVKEEIVQTTQPAHGTAASPAKSRGRPTHSPAQPQRRVGRPMLFVIDGGIGGGPARQGVRPGRLRANGEGDPARKLVLIEGGRGQCTAPIAMSSW